MAILFIRTVIYLWFGVFITRPHDRERRVKFLLNVSQIHVMIPFSDCGAVVIHDASLLLV